MVHQFESLGLLVVIDSVDLVAILEINDQHFFGSYQQVESLVLFLPEVANNVLMKLHLDVRLVFHRVLHSEIGQLNFRREIDQFILLRLPLFTYHL